MVENWTEETAGEYLATLPTEWVTDMVAAVEAGACDPLLAFTRLHRLSLLIEQAQEQIKDQAITEAQKYPKIFQFHGVEISNKSAGSRWDFKAVQEWSQQKAALDAIQDKYKAAFQQKEKGINSVTNDGEEVDTSGVKFIPGKDTIAIKIL